MFHAVLRKENQKMPTEQTVSYGNIRVHESDSCGNYFIGEDLWRQLKRIELLVFNGDKRTYKNWNAVIWHVSIPRRLQASTSCYSFDNAYRERLRKLLRISSTLQLPMKLPRCVWSGDMKVSAGIEDLDSFQQISPGNVKDLVQFSDLLETAII